MLPGSYQWHGAKKCPCGPLSVRFVIYPSMDPIPSCQSGNRYGGGYDNDGVVVTLLLAGPATFQVVSFLVAQKDAYVCRMLLLFLCTPTRLLKPTGGAAAAGSHTMTFFCVALKVACDGSCCTGSASTPRWVERQRAFEGHVASVKQHRFKFNLI
jgi:hypothetical protein